MTIGFDGSRAFIPDRTGTENYSYQLLKVLAKIDKKNKYIVYVRPNYSSNKVRSYHKNINILKVSSRMRSNNNEWPRNFQFKEISWPRFWTQGGLAIQTFKDNIDVLFIPAHTLPLVRKPGLKTVVTVHDLGSEYLPSMHQLKQRLYLSIIQRYQLRTATKLIAVSNATKDDLISRVGCDPKKIEVVYEGYDKKLFRPIKDNTLANRLINYNLQPKTYFLFVGTIQPRKNLERVIKAFAKYSSNEVRSYLKNYNTSKESSRMHSNNNKIQLIIAGSKGWMSDEIYRLPKKLGIEDKVKFLGYVPEKDLPALYCGAKALTFPSLFEGFGLPILEAQACGCPVLTSNVSSMPEVGGKGALYVNPYSVEDIIRGIREIRRIRGELIKVGFENVKRFSWEKCARETLEVLEKVGSR